MTIRSAMTGVKGGCRYETSGQLERHPDRPVLQRNERASQADTAAHWSLCNVPPVRSRSSLGELGLRLLLIGFESLLHDVTSLLHRLELRRQATPDCRNVQVVSYEEMPEKLSESLQNRRTLPRPNQDEPRVN
ncbi:MAG: hypothetical protein [Circular genetic element sp.]|nr:MAG: hypothetical protein [Circular genetic element sp.]